MTLSIERKALLSKLSQRVGSLRHAAGHDANTSLFMGLKVRDQTRPGVSAELTVGG